MPQPQIQPRMTLAEWDEQVAPHLRDIEDASQVIEYLARKISNHTDLLDRVPAFTTKAQLTMIEARDRLVATVHSIDGAILAFGKKDKLDG